MHTTRVRSNYHERVVVYWSSKLTRLFPQLEDLAVQAKGKVRHLDLCFSLNLGPDLYHIFKIITTFGKSLKSLTLVLSDNVNKISNKDGNLPEFLALLSRENLILPSITKLEVDTYNVEDYEKFVSIITAISPIFPNVTNIHFTMIGWKQLEFLFVTKPRQFPALTSFSFQNEPDVDEIPLIPPPEMFFVNIVKLEFSVEGYPPLCRVGPKLLQILAPVLQHVHITEISSPQIVQVPIMPKLRVFKRSRPPDKCSGSRIALQFKTEDSLTGVKLNYKKQFPVLAKISIKCVTQGYKREDDEEDFFEGTVRFLYDTFIPGNISVCETLCELDVPLPPGDEFKFRGMKSGRDRCSGDIRNPVCNCYEWVCSTTFLDHLAATFPNLQYAFLAESKKKVRCDLVKKWVQMGVDLGLLDKSYRVSEDKER